MFVARALLNLWRLVAVSKTRFYSLFQPAVAVVEAALLTRHFATSALDPQAGRFYPSRIGRVAAT